MGQGGEREAPSPLVEKPGCCKLAKGFLVVKLVELIH
jgi:hypothetical protein